MVTIRKNPATKSAVGQEKQLPRKAVPAKSPASQVAQPTQPAAKPLPKTIAKLKTETAVKVKKPKLVRDKFKIPKVEYTVLADLKDRASKLGCPAKKSELLRAGVKALAALPDAAFCGALNALPIVKAGGA